MPNNPNPNKEHKKPQFVSPPPPPPRPQHIVVEVHDKRSGYVEVPVEDLKIIMAVASCDRRTIPYKDFLAAWERTSKLVEECDG